MLETNTNIAEASINASESHRAGPEALSYLGETCFGGPDAGSNRAKSSADGRGWQCDIVEIDFLGQEIGIEMSRARSNVARVHRDRREHECNVNDFHKNIFQGEEMNRGILNASSCFERVKDFITQHPLSDVPAELGVQSTELDDVIGNLSVDSLDQEAGSRLVRAHVESQRKLRDKLYTDHMYPISRVAREVFGLSGMDKAFRMPTPSAAKQKVLAAAAAMAEMAEKEKDGLLKHGLPQDFIEQLRSAASSLGDARNAKVQSARRRTTATAALKEQVKRGKKAVRLLNAILTPRLAKDPELLAAWRSAKRVPPQGGSTAASTAPAAPVAPVAPVTPVAHVVAPQPSSTTEKAA